MIINKKLKSRRIELGLTMAEVAKIVGVSEGTVSRWESGNIGNMKRDKIALYAKALQVSPAYIMGMSDEELWDKEANEFVQEMNKEHEIITKYLKNASVSKNNIELAYSIIISLYPLDGRELKTIKNFIEIISEMNAEGQETVLDNARGLLSLDKYKKCDTDDSDSQGA